MIQVVVFCNDVCFDYYLYIDSYFNVGEFIEGVFCVMVEKVGFCVFVDCNFKDCVYYVSFWYEKQFSCFVIYEFFCDCKSMLVLV